MKKLSLQFGYSLVEVLVAVSILLIAIVGPMTIAAQGIKASTFALEQNSAFFLAQEGIEAIMAIKGEYAVRDIIDNSGDISWDWVTQTGNPKSVLRPSNGPCTGSFSSPNDTCSFGVDFRDETILDNLTSSQCSTADNNNDETCRLYYDEGDSRAVYSHSSSLSASPGAKASVFKRVVTVTIKSANAVEVTSKVTWNSAVFNNQEQSMVLTTNIFDSNF